MLQSAKMENRIKKIRAKILLRLLNFLVSKGDLKELSKKKLLKIVVALVNVFKVEKADLSYYDFFEFWQKKGFSLIPNHFYQPIPDLLTLPKKYLRPKSYVLGVNLNEKKQLEMLREVFIKYKKEYLLFSDKKVSSSYEFKFRNLAYDWIDALVYYCLIRHFKPEKIIEVGSGWSTKIAAKATLRNNHTKLISIEPYPYDYLVRGFPGFSQLIKKRVQNVRLKVFGKLKKNDILFIDSSHTVKIGSDVNHLFFEVLPRLKKGVIVHVHDIFFSNDYPPRWVTEHYKFWNEQYLFQAFLMYNDSFEVMFANSYMVKRYPKLFKKVFPHSILRAGGFWMRKVKD